MIINSSIPYQTAQAAAHNARIRANDATARGEYKQASDWLATADFWDKCAIRAQLNKLSGRTV